MAGKPKDMSIIKQLLILHQQGQGKKTIAKQLGVSKNTIKGYLERIESSEHTINELLLLDNPALEAKLLNGSPSYKDERYECLKDDLFHYAKELKRVGVTKHLLWEEYKEKQPNGYGRSQFCHHLQQHIKNVSPSMVLNHLPADKLYVDFAGKKLSYIDRHTGEIIDCQVFVACLPFSDYGFAMAVHSQGIPDFLYALECCLRHLGGVPKTLTPDNLKSAIIKANNYEPTVNQALSDFVIHFQTTVTPTRARKPKDKALVENQVKIIYNRVYAKIRDVQFFSLASLNESIDKYVLIHNQTRMQRKDYCREEQFLSAEKPHLQALPVNPFQIKYYRELKVAQNNHVYMSVDKRYYSVPYIHIGAKAKVVYTDKLVTIYIKGNKVAVHRRQQTIGYSTVDEHLCSDHRHYLDRSPDYYRKRASTDPSMYE